MKKSNRFIGEPKLNLWCLEEVTKKFMQLMGRDFDTEFNEYIIEQYSKNLQDTYIDIFENETKDEHNRM